MTKEAMNGAAAHQAVLLPPAASVSEATSDQLQDRIKSTVRVQNQAAAIRAEAVAELRRREGEEVAETVLREDGLLARGKGPVGTGNRPTVATVAQNKGRTGKRGDLPG